MFKLGSPIEIVGSLRLGNRQPQLFNLFAQLLHRADTTFFQLPLCGQGGILFSQVSQLFLQTL